MSIMEMDEIIGTLKPLIEYNGGGINSLIENLEQVQEDTTAIKAKGVVKSVQRGFCSYHASNTSSHTIPISAIDPDKSFLFVIAPGYSTRFSWTLNSTSIQFNKQSTSGESDIAWEVVEFY